MDQLPCWERERLVAEVGRDKQGYPCLAAYDDQGMISANNLEGFNRVVVLLITNECPVMCAHCVAHSGGKLRGHMDRDLLRRLIVEAAECAEVEVLAISGGEPFAAPELLQSALQWTRERGLQTHVVTSAHWAESPAAARAIFHPLAALIDCIFISVDHYHQRTIPLEHIRHALRAILETGTTVALQNAMAAAELAEGRRVSAQTAALAREFGIAHLSWPVFDIGRAARLKHQVAQLRPDQPCGMITKQYYYPNGDVHACCAGAAVFHEGHPLYMGNARQRSMRELIADGSRNPLIQAIRALGPVKCLELLGAANGPFRTQCTACNRLCALENVTERIASRLKDEPALLEYISYVRRCSRDRECDEVGSAPRREHRPAAQRTHRDNATASEPRP